MIKEIKDRINEIELENDIRILYACESGSRAWGFESPDSDYDIRFIYIRQLTDYVAINDKPDTIEFPIINNLDFSGWDLKKFLLHVYKSNGVMFEWLQSPVVYDEIDGFQNMNMKLSKMYFRPKSTLHHYLGLTKNTYLDIKETDKVKIKRYFYALRPILAARYIADNNDIPPMDINSLLQKVDGMMNIKVVIRDLMKEKEKQNEGFLINRIPEIDNYLEKEIMNLNEVANNLADDKLPPDKLNQYFYQTVMIDK